jgi:hypothetical protein
MTDGSEMARATVHNLTEKERALVAETRPAALGALDEDALVGLHTRVRRARDKHVGLHRREVAERVEIAGARGTVSGAPRRSASKAEIFEGALARVSASLARAARTSAAILRAERLDAAAAQSSPRAADAPATRAAPTGRAPAAAPRRPIERKTAASTRASGARRQAQRDVAG